MIFDNTFICTVTAKSYFIRGQLNCESIDVINLITCTQCLEQYVRSAVKFKLDSAFINLISKHKRKDLEVPDILIVSAIVIGIRFTTIRSKLVNNASSSYLP